MIAKNIFWSSDESTENIKDFIYVIYISISICLKDEVLNIPYLCWLEFCCNFIT